MDDFLGALTGDLSNLAGTATQFGQGAIASSISGNPLYSNDPAAIGFAVGPLQSTTGTAAAAATNSSSGLFLLVIGYVIYRLASK